MLRGCRNGKASLKEVPGTTEHVCSLSNTSPFAWVKKRSSSFLAFVIVIVGGGGFVLYF